MIYEDVVQSLLSVHLLYGVAGEEGPIAYFMGV